MARAPAPGLLFARQAVTLLAYMADPHDSNADSVAPLPHQPVRRLTGPIAAFLHVEAASGVVLLLATTTAMILANSSYSEAFLSIWDTPIAFGFGDFEIRYSLRHWINDGLMSVFFFVVGLEVKREIVLGELRDLRQAALPIAAALGGMVVPAAIYLALQSDGPAARGWGIPMATDIAFVVGCMAVLGRRVPPALRVMLLSLAIADDIGAILVIAIGYTESLGMMSLLMGFAGIGVVAGLNRVGVRSVGIYTLLGVGIWVAFHECGVHATIAGVILGLQTPARRWVDRGEVHRAIEQISEFLHGDPEEGADRAVFERAQVVTREALSPLERLEALLHPWAGFVIMPLFALANAGVPFSIEDFGEPVALAIALALVIGKPVGIAGFAFVAVRLGLARLPEGVTWLAVVGGGLLAGVGFTMALFIAGLALEADLLDAAKVGILGGSLLAAIGGVTLLVLADRSARR